MKVKDEKTEWTRDEYMRYCRYLEAMLEKFRWIPVEEKLPPIVTNGLSERVEIYGINSFGDEDAKVTHYETIKGWVSDFQKVLFWRKIVYPGQIETLQEREMK